MEAALTPCRVTVNVSGARCGEVVLVDLDDPANEPYLRAGVVVPVPRDAEEPEAEPEGPRPLADVLRDVEVRD